MELTDDEVNELKKILFEIEVVKVNKIRFAEGSFQKLRPVVDDRYRERFDVRIDDLHSVGDDIRDIAKNGLFIIDGAEKRSAKKE